MSLKPIRVTGRQSLAEEVKEHILLRIMSGNLKSGDRLVEMRIANELDISQAPVREAIRELEALGLIETSRNRGARVRVFELREIQEIYDVRAELEGYAARLIRERGTLDNRDMLKAYNDMRSAANKGDVMEFAVQNAAFHRGMVQQAGNMTLLELWDVLDIKSRTFMNIMSNGRDLVEIADSHQKILSALEVAGLEDLLGLVKGHILENKPQDA